MFLFDLIILSSLTLLTSTICNFPILTKILSVLTITVVGLICLFLKGNYKIREFNPTFWNVYRLLEGVVFTHIPLAFVLFFMVRKCFLIEFLVINILAIYTILLIYRFCFHLYLFNIKKVKNILILGTDERARVIADEIQSKYALKMNVAGFIKTDEKEDFIAEKIPVFDATDDIKRIIRKLKINIVVIAQPTKYILKIPRRIKIYKMPEFYELVTGKYYIDEKTITELYYQFVSHHSYVYDFCKRIYDIIAALIILTVTFPIIGIVALRIWLTDHENPIYTQTRIGQDGKPFKCYKLRTMPDNNDISQKENIDKDTVAINDDRVISWCKFIKKAHLDEIPQMINILKGEISIVGPSADWENLADIYSKEIPYYTSRQWIRTGWTGWAQINKGHCADNNDITEKLQYDLYYLKHRNIIWEVSILVKAVFLALSGRHE